MSRRNSKDLRKLTNIKNVIAELGVSRQYVYGDLNDRVPLPEPIGTLSGATIYDATEIEKWLDKLKTARKDEARSKRLLDNANGYFTQPELAKAIGLSSNISYYVRSKGLKPVDPSLLARKTKTQYKLSDLKAHYVTEIPEGCVTARDLAKETKLGLSRVYYLLSASGVSPLPQKLSGKNLFKRSEVIDIFDKHR